MRSRVWSIRARMTVAAGALVLLTSATTLLVSYLLVASSIKHQTIPIEPLGLPIEAQDERVGSTSMAVQTVTKEQLDAYRDRLRASNHDSALPPLLNYGIPAVLVLTGGGLLVGWFVAGRTLRPIQQITSTVRRASDRNLHERVALTGPPDELRELADTFDGMMSRLDTAFDGQRRFVGNASHELKTPLAINRTLIEVTMSRPDAPPQLRHLGEVLLEVNARQENLIDGLLMLARSENTISDPQPVDLAEVAGTVVGVAQPETDRLGVETVLGAARLHGDPVLLERLVQNLVQNAFRYNVDDGWVRVSTESVGKDVRLTVTNTGPDVPPALIPGLFEPFRRATDRVGSARGTGLGLSIVRSVVRAHHGQVTATARDGGGLVVEVALPVRIGAGI
jgi:signal transduction histidine kinase